MKTQINKLLSGTKNQQLNPNKDYSAFPLTRSSGSHSGSNHKLVAEIWSKVISENKTHIDIVLFGKEIRLKAHWSTTGKSVSYHSSLDREFAESKCRLKLAKRENPNISVLDANCIKVSNGKNSFHYLCPSLIIIK